MVLAKFKGIDTVENAEKLRNSYVKIDRKDAIKLEEGQYFIADLLGLEVFLDTGEKRNGRLLYEYYDRFSANRRL